MIEARKNHGLVFVKDKIFAVGGQNSLGTFILLILYLVTQGFMGLFFCFGMNSFHSVQLQSFEQHHQTCLLIATSMLPSSFHLPTPLLPYFSNSCTRDSQVQICTPTVAQF